MVELGEAAGGAFEVDLERGGAAALALDEHAKNDPSVGSAELASLHLARVVGRIPTDRVEQASARVGQRYRMAGITLFLLSSVGLLAAPAIVAEGLDVLVARRGVAPIDISWLESLQVVAQPPAYLRSMDRRIDPNAAYFEPQGSTIVVRGEPTRPGRKLVLTDGRKEIPFTEDATLGVVARYTLTTDAEVRIAARLEKSRAEGPDFAFVLGKEMGLHPLLLDLLAERARLGLAVAPAEVLTLPPCAERGAAWACWLDRRES